MLFDNIGENKLLDCLSFCAERLMVMNITFKPTVLNFRGNNQKTDSGYLCDSTEESRKLHLGHDLKLETTGL
jgi:hypothetical protein